MFSIDGRFVRDITLPGIGTAAGFGGKRTDTETFYSFSSFATPPSIYHYDMPTGASRLMRRAEVKFNPDDYEVKQVFYHSKDGTRVPMFVAHKKGIKLDGSNPTLLYGYGGFNISLPPDVFDRPRGMDGDGRRLRPAEPPRRRRIRRGLARSGHEAEKTERLRRLHRRRRVADRREIHPARQTGHPRRQQRRAVGRRGDDPAAGTVRGLPAGRGRDGHAPLPQVHRGPRLGRRLRLVGQPRAVQGPPGLFSLSQHQAGRRAIRPRW